MNFVEISSAIYCIIIDIFWNGKGKQRIIENERVDSHKKMLPEKYDPQ